MAIESNAASSQLFYGSSPREMLNTNTGIHYSALAFLSKTFLLLHILPSASQLLEFCSGLLLPDW